VHTLLDPQTNKTGNHARRRIALVASELLISRHELETADGISVNHRLGGSVFDTSRLRAKTKSSTTAVFDLQCTDDVALS